MGNGRKSKIITGIIYCIAALFYITDNHHIAWISAKIKHDILRPYQQPSEIPFTNPSPGDSTPKPTEHKPALTPAITYIIITTTPVPAHITERELWDELSAYRSAHNKKAISQNEAMCQYARTRANELIQRLSVNPQEPLDAHAGFQRDADSGYVFEATGNNYVGENLAYTPGYSTAAQIIEWAWDSSPGHRSLQLSDDITSGCITSIHPIYVGIYGH